MNQGGYEIYASVFCSVHEVVVTLAILLWGELTHATMHDLGLIFVISESFFFLLNVVIIASMGWWRKYYSGMIYTFAFKVSNSSTAAGFRLSQHLTTLSGKANTTCYICILITGLEGYKESYGDSSSTFVWISTHIW